MKAIKQCVCVLLASFTFPNVLFLVSVCKYFYLPPQGFRPEGEIPRRHSSNSRVY